MKVLAPAGRTGIGITLAATIAALGAPAPGEKKPEPGAGVVAQAGTDILNANSYFRWRRVTGAVTFADASGPAATPADFTRVKPLLSPNPEDAPLPANLSEVGFDDASWPRVRLGAENVTDGEAVMLGAFRVCLRGRFEVTDPAVVRDLTLGELQFQGGMLVYLNGREVLQQLPVALGRGDEVPAYRWGLLWPPPLEPKASRLRGADALR